MRRFLVVLAGVAVFALPAAATARTQRQPASGFLVVKNATADAGVAGSPVATIGVNGFVIGRIAQEGAVELYPVEATGGAVPQAVGTGRLSRVTVKYHGVTGARFDGTDFRFRGVGGIWRVVVYGSGVSLYAGGVGTVTLHGSATYPTDGEYSFDGARFVSLPPGFLTHKLGGK
jgi:hypothetical protein